MNSSSASVAPRPWIVLAALFPLIAIAATPSFTLTEVPLPAPAQPRQSPLTPTAINSSGQVTGTFYTPTEHAFHAFLYSGAVGWLTLAGLFLMAWGIVQRRFEIESQPG